MTIATNMAGRGTDIKLTKESRELGGLAVLGSERHESRRIDNQLRGRSGRQGDPGFSRFYVSLEDSLMVRFGTDKLKALFSAMGSEDQIESKQVTRSITMAQKKSKDSTLIPVRIFLTMMMFFAVSAKSSMLRETRFSNPMTCMIWSD